MKELNVNKMVKIEGGLSKGAQAACMLVAGAATAWFSFGLGGFVAGFLICNSDLF